VAEVAEMKKEFFRQIAKFDSDSPEVADVHESTRK
jgi:hypothetical protein